AYFRSVARVMVDAAEALHHAHGAGVLHRDVKPSNIMVDKHEQCWLVDFGLARFENGRMGTGTVTFYDSSVILGAGTLSTTNDITTATFSSSSLALGSRSITASYSGDSNFDSSTSAVLTETVLSAQQQAGLIENQ